VKVSPAIVIVPLRGLPVELTATRYCTVPLPVPSEPNVIVIHGTLLIAVQPQPLGKVTANDALPPSEANGSDEGVSIAGGFETVKLAEAELLPLTGSRTAEVTAALLVGIVPLAVPQFTRATMVMVSVVFGAIELNRIERLFPIPLHTPPPVALQVKKVTAEASVSVTVIEFAVSGPLLVTVSV